MSSYVAGINSLPLRMWIGLLLAVFSFIVILIFLSGDISDPFRERAIRARVSPECNGLKPTDTLQIGSEFVVLKDSKVLLKILLFDRINDNIEQQQLVDACSSVRYDLNFIPDEVRYLPHDDATNVERTEVKCRTDFKYCFLIDGDSYRKSRGRITIFTGRSARRETYSSRLLEIGFSSTDTRANIEAEILLPQEAIPMYLVPPPIHMISSASTKLYYRGSSQFGSKKPILGARRSIFQRLGVKITYQYPKKAKVEDIIILISSTIFGIGVALMIEGWFRARDLARGKGETDVVHAPTVAATSVGVDAPSPPKGTSSATAETPSPSLRPSDRVHGQDRDS